MTLDTDKNAFQNPYFVVGTGVIKMPSPGASHLDIGFYEGALLRDLHSRRETARHGVGSSGWLVRLFGHLKSRAAAHRGITPKE
jgi:Uma2 family endonuclease